MNTDHRTVVPTIAPPARSRHLLLLCSLGALLLAACDRRDPDSTAPPVMPARVEMGMPPTTTTTPNTSVPAADSVLSPAPGASQPGAAAVRSNSGMTAAQESSAMPMAGQNNDHSAPVATGKRASSP